MSPATRRNAALLPPGCRMNTDESSFRTLRVVDLGEVPGAPHTICRSPVSFIRCRPRKIIVELLQSYRRKVTFNRPQSTALWNQTI